MSRAKHPKKEVEEALRHAEGHGWRIEIGGSHAPGGACIVRITIPSVAAESFASPASGVRRNVGNHARQLKRVIDNCATRKRAAEIDDEDAKE